MEAVAGAWEPLARTTALTRLVLSVCELEWLPTELSALTNLRELDASLNYSLSGAEGWQPLEPLTGLSRLDLSDCGLRWPPALRTLSRLVELDLSRSLWLGRGGEPALLELQEELEMLPCLARLGLLECGLEEAPAWLAGRPGLQVCVSI